MVSPSLTKLVMAMALFFTYYTITLTSFSVYLRNYVGMAILGVFYLRNYIGFAFLRRFDLDKGVRE